MGKIYVNQTALRIELQTDVNIIDATVKIKYQKPDGVRGEWVASVLDASRGIIYYDIQNATDLDQEGDWLVWAYITFLGGKTAPGETSSFQVFKEGQ